MQFCDECGQLMRPQDVDGKTILACANGHTKDIEGAAEDYTIEASYERGVTDEIIIDDGTSDSTPSATDRFCKKCDTVRPTVNWIQQTRSADEAPTRFYKCTICGTTEREYH